LLVAQDVGDDGLRVFAGLEGQTVDVFGEDSEDVFGDEEVD
jgi:hypothetical protein